MGSWYSWPDPKFGSCYNPNLFFSGRMTQGSGSITTPRWGCVTTWIFIYWKGSNIVKLTPSWGPVTTPHWGCVTTWICISWWGPNIVDLTPSWGPVTTQIHFSLEEWPKDWVLLQFIWPHVGVVLQHEFVNIDGVLILLTWPQDGVVWQESTI